MRIKIIINILIKTICQEIFVNQKINLSFILKIKISIGFIKETHVLFNNLLSKQILEVIVILLNHIVCLIFSIKSEEIQRLKELDKKNCMILFKHSSM